jgi:hypothetical protein
MREAKMVIKIKMGTEKPKLPTPPRPRVDIVFFFFWKDGQRKDVYVITENYDSGIEKK